MVVLSGQSLEELVYAAVGTERNFTIMIFHFSYLSLKTGAYHLHFYPFGF